MRTWAAVALTLLTLYVEATPLLACVIPQRTLTAEERACCRHMAEMCGSAKMPQSHSCCRPQAPSAPIMAVSSTHCSAPALQTRAVLVSIPCPHPATWLEGIALHGPPAEPLLQTTVLRI